MRIESHVDGDIIHTIAYSEWHIRRNGEKILWGEGVLFVDIIDADNRGYELHEGDHVAADDYDHDLYVLLQEDSVAKNGTIHVPDPDLGRGYPVGFAIGEVERKMIPAASPDVTAIQCEPAEDLEPADEAV